MQEDTSSGMPFDPDEFMSQTIDAPMETEYQICPEGSFEAMVADFTSEAFQRHSFTYKQGPRAGQPGSMTTFECPWSILDQTVLASLGRDRVIVNEKFILDKSDNGGLDWGKDKNVKLGQLRAAVDQNNPGPWSFPKLIGAGPALVQVKHIEFERKDGTKGVRAEVVRVAKKR